MATVNKDFKIKQGLVVEGTTATVAGNNILVENTQGTDSYITNLVGGVAYIKSVSSDFDVDQLGNLSINGASDLARTADLPTSADDLQNGSINLFFSDYLAQTAVSNALGTGLGYGAQTAGNVFYVDENYIATRTYADDAAAGALTNAETYTNNQLVAYTTTNDLDSAISGYGYITGAALNGYATESYVGMQGYITLNSLSAGNGIDFNQGIISANYGAGITLGQSNELKVNIGSGIALGAANELTVDFTGYVTETGQQTLTNKTIADNLTISDGQTFAGTIGATQDGKLAINASQTLYLHSDNSNIELVPGQGQHVYINGTSAGNEVATHSYVDNAVSGLAWKQAVNLLAHTSIALTGDATSTSIDGHSLASANGYRVLLTGQTTDSENGIYDVDVTSGTYTFTRAADADAYTELIGAAVYVMEGTTYGGSSWVQGNHYLTDFTGQDWTQFSGTGTVTAGTGITVNGLQVSVDTSIIATQENLADGLALKQDTLTVGDGLDLTSGSLTVVPAEMIDKIITGVSGQSYGLIGNATYLEVDNTNGYNKEIDVNITALESKLDTDGYAKQSDITTAVSTKANAANPTLTGSLTLDGTGDFTITSDSNIVLDPNTTAYLNSATAGNEIATEGYVDDAIAGVTVDYAAMAGTYLDWSGTQFNVDAVSLITTEDLATNTSVGTDITTAINALTTADIEEFAGAGPMNPAGPFYFTDQRAVDAIAGANITPNTVTIDTYRKEEATQQYVANASTVNVHSLSSGFESVKYLVRVVGNVTGTKHSQITEILMTIDGNSNIAITEYGNIHTSDDPLATFSAAMVGAGAFAVPTLTATTAVNGCEIIAAATMLSWAD